MLVSFYGNCLFDFQKWLVLEKHWNMEVIALLVIHALYGYKNVGLFPLFINSSTLFISQI